MKRAVLYLLVMTSIPLSAQLSAQDDTIHIGEVMITGNRPERHSAGSGRAVIDSSVISMYGGKSIADLISGNSPLYIKTYGPGSLASPSFRGTNAGHTAVAWNNITIESPMTGQSDLSLIPAGMADDIKILYGAGSMRISRGSAGGLINLDTKPDWTERGLIMINPVAGSFGRRSGFIKAIAGTNDFKSVTKAYSLRAENDFRYLNSVTGDVPVTEIRENSQVSQKGFSQEFYFRKDHSGISARFWYQKSERNLPVPLITPSINPPERQNDESLRAMLEWDYQISKTKLNLTSAFISDRLDYTNKQASVYSRNTVNRMILKGNIDRVIAGMLNLNISASNELDIVKSNNYDGNRTRNVLSLDAAADMNILYWLSANLLIRETIQDERLLAPDFFAGAALKPFKTLDYFIRAGFSRNSRIPTLNDLYWSPGGNPDLRNETGYNTEITIDISNNVTGSVGIGTDMTFFHNHIKGLIQWRPGEYSYWTADNIDDLVSDGIEANVNISVKGPLYSLRMNSGYTRTTAGIRRSRTAENPAAKTRLMYVPADMVNILLRAERRNVYSTVRFNYTGKRFIDADNSSYLPPYSVTDLNIGVKMTLKKSVTDVKLGLDNIFNIDYQNIAYYPMPRRNFIVSLIFQIKK